MREGGEGRRGGRLGFGPKISCSKNGTTEIILPSLKETEDTTGDEEITGTEPHPKLSPGCSTVAVETEAGASGDSVCTAGEEMGGTGVGDISH